MTNEDITKGFDEIRQLLREMAQESAQRSKAIDQRFEEMAQENERRAQEADRRAQEADRRAQEVDRRAQEATQRSKEIDQRFEATERLIREMAQENERRAQEAKQRSKEIDQRFEDIAQRFEDTDNQFKDIAQQFKETGQQIKELKNLFTNQWGRLIEALVEPGIITLFQQRGINVKKRQPRAQGKRKGKHMEIDLILKNKTEKVAVIVEVKTTLRSEDVAKFLNKFDAFLDYFPKYKGYTIYGAVAGIQIDKTVSIFAYRQGLFVLGLGNEGLIRMLNDENFKPTIFYGS